MTCEFTDPVTYNDLTPTDYTDSFQFKTSTCTYDDITIQNTSPSTPSAFIDIASTSALSTGIQGLSYIIWFIGFVIILYAGFSIGHYIYKR